MVTNPPVVQENWVWSLGWEDPLEEGMVIHSSILAWRIPPGQPGGLQSMDHKQSDMTEQLSTPTPVYQAEEVLTIPLSQVEHKQTTPLAQDS